VEYLDAILNDLINPVGFPPSVNATHALIVSIPSIVWRVGRL
jgi:hypothetical protein